MHIVILRPAQIPVTVRKYDRPYRIPVFADAPLLIASVRAGPNPPVRPGCVGRPATHRDRNTTAVVNWAQGNRSIFT